MTSGGRKDGRRGGGPAVNKFKNRRRSCVDRLRVSTNHGAFETSRLDDEQPSGPAETTTGPARKPEPKPTNRKTG